jgi:hypothetical protein
VTDGPIVINFVVVHIDRGRRTIGPRVGYRVQNGGTEMPLGGTLLSTTIDHEEDVQRIASELEEEADLSEFDHGDLVARGTWEGPDDDGPTIDLAVDVAE